MCVLTDHTHDLEIRGLWSWVWFRASASFPWGSIASCVKREQKQCWPVPRGLSDTIDVKCLAWRVVSVGHRRHSGSGGTQTSAWSSPTGPDPSGKKVQRWARSLLRLDPGRGWCCPPFFSLQPGHPQLWAAGLYVDTPPQPGPEFFHHFLISILLSNLTGLLGVFQDKIYVHINITPLFTKSFSPEFSAVITSAN